MKRHLGDQLPSWSRWSDGRAFTHAELKRFRWMRKRTQHKGESFQAWFMRIRGPIERYEAARARVITKPPGLIARAVAWVRGRPAMTELEIR